MTGWMFRPPPRSPLPTARLELGNTSKVEWFRGIGEYLAKDGEQLIILFGGSTKKEQQKAIDLAVLLHIEYKARKKAATAATKKGNRL